MTYASEVLADNPWGFWEQKETSGTALADSSPNARAMTITGTPTLAQTGPDGAAADAVKWPSSAGTAESYASGPTVSTSVCTVEAWVYLTATPTALTPILATAAAYASNTQRISLYLDTSGRPIWMTYRGGTLATFLTAPSALSLNAWHHVVASIGAAGAKTRVDKVTLVSDAGTAISAGSEAVFLHGGGNSGSSADFTNGSPVTIAVPAFYTSQLSDARTDAHYDAMNVVTPLPTFTGIWGLVF